MIRFALAILITLISTFTIFLNVEAHPALIRVFGRIVTVDSLQGDTVQVQAAAKDGKAEAQNQLGVIYFFGKGVKRDYVKAAH